MNKLLSLAFALAGATACAQTTLQGTITNTEGQPLFGVAVVVGDQAFGTTTDAQGAYRLAGLRPGPVRVRLSHVGHAPVDTTFSLQAGGNTADLTLRTKVYEIREAEVTAVRAGDRTPVAKSTLTREQIERINTGVDLPILLDLQP
ncbi:MAG: carboxypeptidase regulatory-like domain-containing protein, partial [Flavobacteriales bacterium]|nr:carboxypeptidase regulatory-like domain-containing protein [Flavobacteriales bacterium]